MTVRSSRVRAVWGVVVASALLVSVGCGSDASPDVSVTDTSTTTTPSVESSAQRGVVFDSEPFTSTAEVAASGASAVKILYGSTSGIDGRETQVSGTVFTPPGTPPEGGWPIVSIGHGTTGISDDCAPSASPTLFGTIGLVAPFLDSGYVVAVSDFEGLGTPDPHPYLQPDTAAFNVIDAVRAARNVVPDTLDSLGNSGAVPRRAGILGGSRGSRHLRRRTRIRRCSKPVPGSGHPRRSSRVIPR